MMGWGGSKINQRNTDTSASSFDIIMGSYPVLVFSTVARVEHGILAYSNPNHHQWVQYSPSRVYGCPLPLFWNLNDISPLCLQYLHIKVHLV